MIRNLGREQYEAVLHDYCVQRGWPKSLVDAAPDVETLQHWEQHRRRRAASVWHGLVTIAQLVRQRPGEVKRLERRYVAAVQDRWEEVWPDVSDQIVVDISTAAQPRNAIDRAIERGRRDLGQWIDEPTRVTLVDLLASGFGAGHTGARRSADRLRARSVQRAVGDGTTDAFQDAMDTVMTVDDQNAARWLERDSLFWINESWDSVIGPGIAREARDALEAGIGRRELASRLQSRFTKFDRPEGHWRVIASSSLVRARSFGAVSGFETAGVQTFRFMAILDERTSPICREMDGRTFDIEQGRSLVDRATGARNPEQLKTIAPWVSADFVADKNSSELAAAGVMLPPLHGNCRSLVVAESFTAPTPTDTGIPPEEGGGPMAGTRQLGASDVRARRDLEPARWHQGRTFDPGALGAAMRAGARRPVPPGTEALLPTTAGRQVRRELNTAMAHYGMMAGPTGKGGRVATPPGRAPLIASRQVKLAVFTGAAALGYMAWSGQMGLRQDVYDDAERFLDEPGAEHAEAMTTLMHQTAHSFTNHGPGARTSLGKLIDEGTAEAVARRVVLDQWPQVPPEAVANRGAVYQRLIDDLEVGVREAASLVGVNLTDEDVESLVADAGIRMRRGDDLLDTDVALREAFIAGLDVPGIGDDRRGRFQRELRRLLQFRAR